MFFSNINSSMTMDKVFNTKIKFIVSDEVKTQVVDQEKQKVIHEIPINNTANILLDIYA